MTGAIRPVVRRPSRSREALLAAARAVILECGVDDLRVADVIDRADVALGAFYKHFGTKDAVVDAVAVETMTTLVTLIDGAGQRLDDPAEVVSLAIRWIVDLGTSSPDLARLILRLEASAPALESLITPRATRYFERGQASGRFFFTDLRLAIRIAIAAMTAALRSVVDGDSSAEAGSVAAQAALLSIGLDRGEAVRVASLDLPLLPGSVWSTDLTGTGDEHGIAAADEDAVDEAPAVLAAVADGVMRLELNRPQALNALNRTIVTALREALAGAASDPDVRCVVITGAGPGFCSGWDVASPGPDDDGVLDDLLHPLIQDVRNLPKPVVSVVRGGAVGFGCALAIAADLVVATESSYFLLAFARIGLSGDGGVTATLPARVGLGRATRMMLLAERVPGPEALACGLADYVVDDLQLDRTVAELTARLASGPTRSYRATKELLANHVLPDLRTQLDRERHRADDLIASDDYAEGLRAFAERRPPRFTGR